MRCVLSALLALVAAGCGQPASVVSPPSSTAQQCTYEIVQPDKSSPTAAAFRSWLKPRAADLFGSDDAAEVGEVFIADLNNDAGDEVLFALHEGSAAFLNATVFRQVAGTWSQVHPPFDDRLTGSHEYRGTLMTDPQLVARLCGQAIFNFMAGSEPNYYPASLVWERDTARRVCSEPWLTHHRAAAADLEKRGMLDEALVLLNGIQHGCEKESPAGVRSIKDDISRIAAKTAAASSATYDFSWLMNEVKLHPGQQLVLDPRFNAMLIAILPNVQIDDESFRGALKKSVWLPDDPTIIDDRYLVIAGCEPHNCGNRGFVWIDTVARQGIGMTNGALASRTISPSSIPNAFWTHMRSSLADWPNQELKFIDANGRTTIVKTP